MLLRPLTSQWPGGQSEVEATALRSIAALVVCSHESFSKYNPHLLLQKEYSQ